MKYKRSFVNFFIENFRITYLLMVALVIFGVLAVIQMPKESAPEVDIPVVVITTPFPGAGAENVEDLITTPIENQVSGITEIESIDSSSQQGLSTVIIQFDVSADSSEMTAEVRDRVDRASSDFPTEAGESSIRKISFSDVPIMRMALAGPLEPTELKIYADQLKDELETVRDVSQVSVLGSPEREIRIRLDENRLRDLSLTPDMVIGALSRGNIDLPIGSIETGESIYALRLDSKLFSAEEIRRVPVLEKNGALITVNDVAEIEDGFAPLGNISRFSIKGSQPKATVSLQIFKESGQGDILTIADSIKEKVNTLQEENFPEGVEVEIIQSDAEVIRSDLNTLVSSGFLTIIIIVLTLTLFIGWREALQASLVVPFSFLASFAFIEAFGLTINFLTLFSLILSLGILVDASIVVTESIFNKRAAGLSGCDAAQETIEDFQAPLIAGTMTTVFVFAPMLIMGGIMGEFIKSIPITVSAVLLSALFVALVFITTIATRFLVKPPVNMSVGLFGVGRAMEYLSVWYRKKLSFILESKRAAYILLGSVTFLFILAIALPFIGVVSVNMFPSPDSDSIFIDLEASPGTPFERTSDLIRPIEERLRQDPNVDSFLTIIGQSSEAGSIDLAQAGDSNRGSITVTLNEERDLTSQEIVVDYREVFKDYSDAEVRFSQPEAGPGGEGAVRINLIGEDLDELERVARELSEVLSSIEGTENVDDGIKSTAGELVINVDRATAGYYGLNPSDIAGFLRTSLFGRTATEINISEDEIGLVVLSDLGKERNTVGRSLAVDVSEIESMTIQTPRGPVALNTFINIDLKPGRSSIEHRDGDRFLAITSDVVPGYNAQSIVANFREGVKDEDLPADVEITYGGEVEEIQESFMDLFKVMLIGVLLIFTLMVWQFKSYLQPFFILITVPLALTGVFFGLAIVRQPLSFPGFIGIVALVGIVVNNAIILIDVINKKYLAGEDLERAILSGARSRFRPVVLTTATTVLALIPLVFASPEWSPVAYSIIFGLLFSTVLTLAIIPLLYQLFTRGKAERK